MKFLEIIFKNNKQKQYPLIISWNLHILAKCSFIDICVIIFQKKNSFSVIAHMIFILNTLQYGFFRSSQPEMFYQKGVLKNLKTFTGKQLCWSLILVKLCAAALVQYSFLVGSL